MNLTTNLLLRAAVAAAITSDLALSAEPMRLRQVLDAAAAKADRAPSGESTAKAQLDVLRSLARTKVELRPQVGAFSFSQPSLVATSTGAAVVVSRRTAPGTGSLQAAELDVLAAEITHRRERLRVEIETARQFFDLVAKQENADRTCASVQDGQRRQGEIARLVKAAKLTAVDLARFEEQMLDRQIECVDAETQRKLAAVQLATFTGMSESSDLRVEDADLLLPGPERPLPAREKLFELAMTFRPEPAMIRDQIAAAAPKNDAVSRLRPDLVTVGYYQVQQNNKLGGTAPANYLLGGNTLRAEVTWNVPLRNTGENAAAKHLLETRIAALESQLEMLRDEIRNQLAAVHILAMASLEKLPVARRRLDLVNKSRNLIATRFQSGLGTSAVLFEAEQQSVRAQGSFTQAACDLKASTFLMMALLGIENKPEAEQESLLGYSAAPPQSENQTGNRPTSIAVSR